MDQTDTKEKQIIGNSLSETIRILVEVSTNGIEFPDQDLSPPEESSVDKEGRPPKVLQTITYERDNLDYHGLEGYDSDQLLIMLVFYLYQSHFSDISFPTGEIKDFFMVQEASILTEVFGSNYTNYTLKISFNWADTKNKRLDIIYTYPNTIQPDAKIVRVFNYISQRRNLDLPTSNSTANVMKELDLSQSEHLAILMIAKYNNGKLSEDCLKKYIRMFDKDF